MARALPSRSLAGVRRYWLLRLAIAGRVLWLASAPVRVPRDDGSEIICRGGLSRVEFAVEVLAGQDEADAMQVAIELVLGDVDWAALRARGHDLSAGTGELVEWAPGLTWEQRRPILLGRVTEPSYGVQGQRLSFSLAADVGSDAALIPSAAAVIDATTWPDAPSDNFGTEYPSILGVCGEYRDAEGVTQRVSGSKGYNVDSVRELVLIAGHRLEAEQVELEDDAGAVDTVPVEYQYDGRGRLCALVDLTVLGAPLIDTTQSSYGVRWSAASGWGGGLPGRAGKAMQGAGEITRWLLQQTSLPVHLGQVDTIVHVLDRYRLACAIGSSTSPSEYLQRMVLPLLPVGMTPGPRGTELHLVRFSRPVATLSTEQGLSRLSPPELDRPALEVTSEIRLRYAVDELAGEALRGLTLSPLPDSSGDEIVGTWRCRESYRQYSRRPGVTARRPPPLAASEELKTTYDRPTVARVGRDRIEQDGHVPELLSYWDAHRLWDWVRPGHTVRLVDPALSLDGVHAFVQAVEERDFRRAFRLRLRAPRRY